MAEIDGEMLPELGLVHWDCHDLLSATELVRRGLTEAHPELSGDAVDPLVWDFSCAHW